MKKETSVEWYIEQRNLLENALRSNLFGLGAYFQRKSEIENQAKQMEKEQMKEAALDNVTTNEKLRKIFEIQFEQYYNETYRGTQC
jgi:hypothetical protein